MENAVGVFAILFLCALVFALYFMPVLIALDRKHPQVVPIGIINFFFGWTMLGWVGCLAWAFQARPTN